MMVQIQQMQPTVPQTTDSGKSAPEQTKTQDGLFQRLMNSTRVRQGEKDRGETRDSDAGQTPQASVLWALPGSAFPVFQETPELSANAGQTGAAAAVAGVLQTGAASPENALQQTAALLGDAPIEQNQAGSESPLQAEAAVPAQNVPAASFAVPEASTQTAFVQTASPAAAQAFTVRADAPQSPAQNVPAASLAADGLQTSTVQNLPAAPAKADGPQAPAQNLPAASAAADSPQGASSLPTVVTADTAQENTGRQQENAFADTTPGRGNTPALIDAAAAQPQTLVIPVSDNASLLRKPTVSQVADRIVLAYKEKNPEFRMELHPKELGRVSVKISMEKDVLTVSILADDPRTQSLLMSGSQDIRSLLQSAINQPVLVTQPQDAQNMQPQADDTGRQHAQQQQQQSDGQQQETPDDAQDFVSFLQQLRIRQYTV